MPMFSVIVPVYNACKTIERCVESIVASGNDDVEIVLIEDCSRDNSWDVCCALQEKYMQVHCFRNECNRGVSYTRNQGLLHARGEYLLFVDSDDWVSPQYVPAFAQAIAMGSRFAVCGFINHDEKNNGRTDYVMWESFEGMRRVSVQDEIETLYAQTLLQQLWNKVFEASVIKKHQICFDEVISIGEDTRFVLEYIRKGKINEILLINQTLYHYMRDQSGSLMFRVGYESVEEPLKNLSMLYDIVGLSEEEKTARLQADREKQIQSYSYLIMHNAGMSMREKRRLILALDEQRGKKLFWKYWTVFIKERIAMRCK